MIDLFKFIPHAYELRIFLIECGATFLLLSKELFLEVQPLLLTIDRSGMVKHDLVDGQVFLECWEQFLKTLPVDLMILDKGLFDCWLTVNGKVNHLR